MPSISHGRVTADGCIDFAPLPKGDALGEAVVAAIDAAAAARNAAQPPRTYLGGSMLGWPCDRQLGFYWHRLPKDPGREVEGRVARLFDMGHHFEPLVAGWFRAAGYDLVTHDASGEQFGWALDGGRIKGHIDGVFLAGPVGRFPCLWENKGLKAKKWAKLVASGLRDAQWDYFVQCQGYMQQMDLAEHPALFTALNKDTSELYVEFVKFDPEVAAEAIARGQKVVRTSKPQQLDRVAKDPSDYRCKFCDWRERCWADKTMPKARTEKPAWLARAPGVASVAT